jgi:hypothetical protein
MAIEGRVHDDRERDRRLRFLVAAGTVLAENITDYEATLKTIARLAVASRIADVCLFDVLDERGGPQTAAVSAVRSEVEERLLQAGRFLRSDSGRPPHPVLRVIMDRASHLVPEVNEAYIERTASSAGHAAFMREIGYRSKMIVPVVAGGAVLGTLTLVRTGADAEPFDEADVLLAEDLGRRAGVAYENARAYARQLRVATLLQEASLPGVLAPLPHGRFDALYRPGSREALIGGDWYDAFPLDDGRVGITIGDVLGSGVAAAVTMGRLRQAMQSAAYVEPDPNVMIYAADRVLTHNDRDVYATALAAIYDPERRRLCLASGGHPGPLERRVDGAVIDHSIGGVMLGVQPERRSEYERIEVQVGSVLVFFTDGLIEQTKNIEEGYERLRAALRELDPRSPHPARDIVEAVVAGALRDDVAVLVLVLDERRRKART